MRLQINDPVRLLANQRSPNMFFANRIGVRTFSVRSRVGRRFATLRASLALLLSALTSSYCTFAYPIRVVVGRRVVSRSFTTDETCIACMHACMDAWMHKAFRQRAGPQNVATQYLTLAPP
jgi:hypothetical protein